MRTRLLILVFGCILLCPGVKAQGTCSLPKQLFALDTLLSCKDSSFLLAVSKFPNAIYQWSNGGTDTSITITRSGKYWLDLSDSKCSTSDTVFILFNSFILGPEIDTNVLCLNTRAQALNARGANLKWYDTLAIGGTPTSQAPVPTTNQLGQKMYYVSQTIFGCESPRSAALVEVIDKPGFDLGENILIPCGASGISLQVVEEKYTSYRWTNGTIGPVYDATRAGTYILRGDNICGSKTDTVIAVDCDTKCVQFPNAFTPNGDGLNDVFRATSFCPVEKFRLVIANRFGEILYETRNPKDKWDGKWMGKAQVTGTYVFYCQYNDFVLKKDIFFKGSFMLLK
jgi:gliding motility-associated-like protein